jgi:hypothetical protein
VALAVPAIFIDMTRRLSELGAHTTEGIFRVPGETEGVAALRRRYQAGQLLLEEEGDVHVWASLLKLWLRELTVPLIVESCYDAAIAIASTHLARAKQPARPALPDELQPEPAPEQPVLSLSEHLASRQLAGELSSVIKPQPPPDPGGTLVLPGRAPAEVPAVPDLGFPVSASGLAEEVAMGGKVIFMLPCIFH